MTIEHINKMIWGVFNGCSPYDIYDLGNRWGLMLSGERGTIWDLGVTLGKVEDGEFIEERSFDLSDYAETFAEIFENGSKIIESMANDIFKYIQDCEIFEKNEREEQILDTLQSIEFSLHNDRDLTDEQRAEMHEKISRLEAELETIRKKA